MIIFDKDKGFRSDIRQVVLQTYDIYALEKIIDRTLPIQISIEDVLYDFLDDPDVHLNSYFYTCESSGRQAIMNSDYAQIVDILKNCIMFNKNKPGFTFNNIAFNGITLDADNDNFDNITNPPYVPLACPSHGGFIGWKKALSMDGIKTNVLIKLYIPADAKRLSATGKKCRCDRAKVLDITTLDGKHHFNEAMSLKDLHFIYKVGEYVIPDWFDPDRFDECSSGIHFFINKQDAIDY